MTKRRWLITLALAAGATAVIVVAFLPRGKGGLYRVTILPSLGGDMTFAEAINDLGQVVGVSSVPGDVHHAFLWDRDHGMRDLGPIGWPEDINNEGRICGTWTDPNSLRGYAFIVDPEGTRRLLDTLGGRGSSASAINNHGLVVGELRTGTGSEHAFIWDEPQGMRDLCPPGADGSAARGIDDQGRVLVVRFRRRMLLWDPNGGFLSTCETAPVNFSESGAINDMGRVALSSRCSASRSRLMISDGAPGWRTVHELRGDIVVDCLNNAGQVVFVRAPRRPAIPLLNRLFRSRLPSTCLWDPHLGVISLDRYIPQGSPMQFVVHGLNNHGCIVGTFYSLNSKRRWAVLLEPIPERWGR